MPQMMPLNWMLLFLFSIIIFIMFNIFNYFMYNPKSNKHMNMNFFKKKITWKW
uniref:ATP synthase complex subunit 8 n=1 Tax=Parasa consocia TaxID=1481755 RepID=A0A1X9IQR7_PARCO|nr:ATP synthase F0 subunit 8 [Parasa consocia]APH08559.1 ATP synthase F0 subunit 8 [Parasa consocia]UMR54992.1 ATP synthase F0 subunit 8 [Parasa consocia]